MTTHKLNPNHPITQAIGDHGPVILAIVMHKLGLTDVEITVEDMASFVAKYAGHPAMIYDAGPSSAGPMRPFTVRLRTMEEGRAMAAKEGGKAF